ncbi:hypothetical protein Pan241w_14540 [Gimesia alba]|uniref:Uncharacterized protein n=1 Tax=Gimesia alba TaxID=2527973 RepID=A0A517RC42_9PLAN|nr:hypothetical protein Pan241w_14540 [Gimesia alba]
MKQCPKLKDPRYAGTTLNLTMTHQISVTPDLTETFDSQQDTSNSDYRRLAKAFGCD